MARQNKTYVLAERPTTHIVPGKTFKLEVTPAPTADDLKDGQALIETLYLSLDPAMRGWINDMRSYTTPVAIGEKMRGGVLARVIASKTPKAKVGDIVTASTGWTELAVVGEKEFQKLEVPKGGKLTDLMGVLGMTGMTAWTGLHRIGQPKAGETVVVSGAAGATGSVVGQIAKLRGSRVIGIAGSDDKCEWLKNELGFDVALNYKSETFKKDFEAATPDYIDMYWDNVGGEILELALTRAKKNARFVMCGSISGYNQPGRETKGIRNLSIVVSQRIRMEGFIVFDFLEDWPRAREEIGQWLSEGKFKRKETIAKGGLEVAEHAISDLFEGKNTGKLLVEVKSPDE